MDSALIFVQNNWWWICPIILIPVAAWLKKKAKKTEAVWDDKVATLIWLMLKKSVGKGKDEKLEKS